MKQVWASFCSAFLMYSKIPVPKVEWKEENRIFSLCFFPLVGAVIGCLLVAFSVLADMLQIHPMLYGVICACIPIIITGGIHLDGFMDVSDAKACLGSREKMLEVMKDSHVGAFAVMHLCILLLCQVALLTQLGSDLWIAGGNDVSSRIHIDIRQYRLVLIYALGFVQSRAYSGLGAMLLKNARSSGSLQSFSKAAHKKITIVVECIYILGSGVTMIVLHPLCGTLAVLAGGLSYAYYIRFSYDKFGGITGDLAGYFVCIFEVMILAVVTMGGCVWT